MPITGIMQRGLRLPRLGTIRKGVQVPVMSEDGKTPKKNKKGGIVTRPKELPWFVFKCAGTNVPQGEITKIKDDAERQKRMEELQQASQIERDIYTAYGTNQVKEINCFLAYPDAFRNFSFWLEAYNFNQKIATSDETTLQYLFDVETNETLIKDGVVVKLPSNPNTPAGKIVAGYALGAIVPHQKDMVLGEAKDSGKAIMFKASGRLHIVIAELRRLAFFTVITGGYWYDIPQIWSTIEMVDQIVKSTGRGANTIPLTLRRVEREHQYTAEDGSIKKKIGYDIELEIRSDVIAGLLQSYDSSPFALTMQNNNQPVLAANVGTEVDMLEDYETGDGNEEEPEDQEVINARQVLVTVRGTEKFMGELKKDQLKYLIENSKNPLHVTAAKTVLEHDFGG